MSLAGVGVDIVLYCCSAYRAMNAAALATYEAIRRDGTQKNVLERMQTRADLYRYLDYHAYEAKLDELFAEGKENHDAKRSRRPPSNRRNPWPCRASPPATPRLCTVGSTGNDLHYRGYDILDIATECEFEEIAYLLVHEKLPNRAELAAYKAKLARLRGLPPQCSTVLEQLPASSHPMDVLRTGVSALGCFVNPRPTSHPVEAARDIADRLLACLGSMLCYWHHYANHRPAHRARRPTMIRSARISCTCCMAASPRRSGCAPCTPRSIYTPSTNSTPRPSPRG